MYRARFFMVGSLVLSAVAGLALLTLIPAYLALAVVAPSTDVEHTLEGERIEDPTAIARAQALVTAIGPLLVATSSPTEVLSTAIGAKPSGVLIDRVSYRAGQLVLSGSASRESIEAFRTALAVDTRFSSISIPVSALVGRDGNRFSITIAGSF